MHVHPASLEALLSRHFSSSRGLLVAIVSQNSFVLVFVAYRTIVAQYVAKWGVVQMCLCETKYQIGGGVLHQLGGAANLLE